jgi:hypothetical protein
MTEDTLFHHPSLRRGISFRQNLCSFTKGFDTNVDESLTGVIVCAAG